MYMLCDMIVKFSPVIQFQKYFMSKIYFIRRPQEDYTETLHQNAFSYRQDYIFRVSFLNIVTISLKLYKDYIVMYQYQTTFWELRQKYWTAFLAYFLAQNGLINILLRLCE